MGMARKQGCWLQCVSCGEIHFIEKAVPIDQLYVTAMCPKCGHYKAINCGDKKDDIVLYADSYLDERYYQY